MDMCYARGYCTQYNTSQCTPRCDLYYKLELAYKDSNIPKRYRYDAPLRPEAVDKPAFLKLKEIQDNIVHHVKEGHQLLIYSTTVGNGKTSWATKIANHYIRKTVAKGRPTVLYLNTSTFLEQLRESFKGSEAKSVKQQAMDCDILILDDLGAEKPTEWVCERLYDIINHRYTNCQMTIATSNLSPEEIGDRLGTRIESRLKSDYVVEFVGGDRR